MSTEIKDKAEDKAAKAEIETKTEIPEAKVETSEAKIQTPEVKAEIKIFRTYSLLPQHADQTVQILGWVRKMRTSGKIIFMEISGNLSHTVQVVLKKRDVPQNCVMESYVSVTGLVKKLPEGVYSALPVEIQGLSMIILGPSKSDYPTICPSEAGPQTRLEQRHMYLRDPTFALITKLRAQLLTAMRQFFDDMEVTEIVPPCFTGVECEGGASLFKVPYPGKSTDKPVTAYLTQSSQFALEMALPGVGDCYCLYPSFRAENSHTRRHLTEFLHLEAEWAGILTFEDHCNKLMELLDGIMTRFIVIAEKTLKDLKAYDRVQDLCKMCKPDQIVILEHKDAIEELKKRGIFKDAEKQEYFGERDDIPEAQERQLIDEIGKIVFLCKFPKEFKSFYMGLDPKDTSRVLGVDVECPGIGEVIGSGVREHSHERLLARLLECGLNPDDYREYTDLRAYGFGRSSGMGLGVDRMLTWILGLQSIRDVVSFPRVPGYLRP